MTRIERLKEDVEEHGEVHAILVDDIDEDRELEIRKGPVEWDVWLDEDDEDAFTIRDGHGNLRAFWYDDIVHWYKPREIWH